MTRTELDSLAIAALQDMTLIECRKRPDREGLVRFSVEGWPDDAAALEKFYDRNLGIFNGTFVKGSDDIVLLLEPEFFLYWLPSMLLSMLANPRGRLGKSVTFYLATSERIEGTITSAERTAAASTIRYAHHFWHRQEIANYKSIDLNRMGSFIGKRKIDMKRILEELRKVDTT